MSYKFQRGAAVLSGSIKAEDGLDANSAGFAGAGAIAGASSIDGTGDLTMGTITMTGFSVDADGDMTCKSIVIPDDATIGASGDTDMITLDAGADVTFASDLNVVIGKTGGLQLADGAVTSTANELNRLDGVGAAVTATKLTALSALENSEIAFLDGADSVNDTASKAVIMNASNGFTFQDSDNSGDSLVFLNPNVSNNAELKIRKAFSDIEAIRLHASNGISLDGTNFISSAEINVLNSVTAGTAAASKAVVLDSSKDISGINNLTVAGNLTVNGTTTTVNTDNLLVKDNLITLNDGGDTTTSPGAGIEVEEGGSATGFVKVAADRMGWLLQAPGSNATIELSASAASTVALGGNLTTNGAVEVSVFGASLVDDANASAARTTLGLGNMAEQSKASVDIDGGDIASSVVINKSPVVNFNSGDVQGSITLSNLASGTGGLTIQAGAVEATMLNTNVISGQGNFTGNSTDIENADEILFSDNGVLKRLSMQTAQAFFQTGVTADTAGGFTYSTYNATSSAIANAAGSPGYFVASGSSAVNPLSASVSTTLHLSGGNGAGDNEWQNGMIVYAKAPSNASSFNLTIVASGSERIDGEQQIVLESDSAAVTLLRCHNSRWSIV